MDLMNKVFKTYLDKFVVISINDILIYSNSKEEHVEYLRTALWTLEEHKSYAKLKTCEFWLERVHFQCHVVTKMGY